MCFIDVNKYWINLKFHDSWFRQLKWLLCSRTSQTLEQARVLCASVCEVDTGSSPPWALASRSSFHRIFLRTTFWKTLLKSYVSEYSRPIKMLSSLRNALLKLQSSLVSLKTRDGWVLWPCFWWVFMEKEGYTFVCFHFTHTGSAPLFKILHETRLWRKHQ